MSLKCAVVGCGLAGRAVALAIQRSAPNVAVKIFEKQSQVPEPRTMGSDLVPFNQRGLESLELLGLKDRLMEKNAIRAHNGLKLYQGKKNVLTYQTPVDNGFRRVSLKALNDEIFEQLQPSSVLLSSEFQNILVEEKSFLMETTKSHFEVDVVFGCDGENSKVGSVALDTVREYRDNTFFLRSKTIITDANRPLLEEYLRKFGQSTNIFHYTPHSLKIDYDPEEQAIHWIFVTRRDVKPPAKSPLALYLEESEVLRDINGDFKTMIDLNSTLTQKFADLIKQDLIDMNYEDTISKLLLSSPADPASTVIDFSRSKPMKPSQNYRERMLLVGQAAFTFVPMFSNFIANETIASAEKIGALMGSEKYNKGELSLRSYDCAKEVFCQSVRAINAEAFTKYLSNPPFFFPLFLLRRALSQALLK